MNTSIVPRAALLLVLPMSTVCHSTAIVNAISDELVMDALGSGLNTLHYATGIKSLLPYDGELAWSLTGGACSYRSVLGCLMQSNQQSIFRSNNRVYFGSRDFGSLRIRNIYSENIATGSVDYLYVDESVEASTEVPVPAVGLQLMAAVFLTLATIGRKRRQYEHAQH